MKMLSKNFTLEEMTKTDTGLENSPLQDDIVNLLFLCQYILQPIRDMWGKITINSGYRSGAVNERVGGSPTSQHRYGEAADIVSLDADIDKVFHWFVYDASIPFGQAILENKNGKRWIHMSLPRLDKENFQALVFKDGEYKPLPPYR
jgi:hypothetical protein